MKRIVFLGVLLTATPLIAGETGYRVVHPDGTVEFTDQPSEGAKEITIQQIPTFPAQPPTSPRPISSVSTSTQKTPAPADAAVEPTGNYESIVITSPSDQETVMFDENGMSVTVLVKPDLDERDKVVVRLDGVKVASESSTTFTLKNIYRGSHTLTAAIADANGNIIREAPPVTFFMQQQSLLNPNSPLFKSPTPTP